MKFITLIYLTILLLLFSSCEKDVFSDIPDEYTKELNLDSLKILTTDLPSVWFSDLTFVNSNTAFAISQGIIAKTNSGGLNWSIYHLNDENINLLKVQFLDTQIGYTFGINQGKGVLLKTIDGGLNWNNINYGSNETLNGMFFITKDVGFLVGSNVFSKTTNGGATWLSLKNTDNQVFNDVNFKNDSEGIVTANNGLFLKTLDGGLTWNSTNIAQNNNLGKIYFIGNKQWVSIDSNSFYNLNSPFEKVMKPSNLSKFLIINSQQSIGIGNHYQQSDWPYGDVMISNDNLKTFSQKTFAPAKSIAFGAIAKMNEHKVMIIGIGFDGPLVLTLNL